MDKPSLESGWIDRLEPQDDRPGSWAFQLALCLLGPLFFLSYLFTILSPLPALYLHVGTPHARRGRIWALLALLIGTLLCTAVKGWLWGGLAFFLVASVPALVLGELLLRKQGVEKAVAGAFLALSLMSLVSSWIVAKAQGVDLLPTAKQAAEEFIRSAAERILTQETNDLPDATKEDLKTLKEHPEQLLEDLPGIATSLLLLLCTLPCVALIRWNPKGFLRRTGINRDFLRRWKSPDWFVWLALFCGVFLVFEQPYLSTIARNALKPILLIYFFQGMSILAYFLDSLRLRGPFRILFYGAAILFLTPMVVSFGFFDLWFNFRGRNRPVDEEKL